MKPVSNSSFATVGDGQTNNAADKFIAPKRRNAAVLSPGRLVSETIT